MPTEPTPLTVADAIRRAVRAVDPAGLSGSSSEVLERFEDRDEPISSLEDPEAVLAEALGWIDPQEEDGWVSLVRVVATYLAFRRDEATEEDDDELLRLAARAEYGGDPPPEPVTRLLADRGIAL